MTALLGRRALLLAPSGFALLGGAGLLVLRQYLRQPDLRQPVLQPTDGASPLLGRKLPGFALAGLPGKPGFAAAEVTAAGRPILLNFFASWCLPCQQEIPVLLRLAQGGLPVWGIDFRDKPHDATGFLQQHGDPYQRVGCDEAGETEGAFGLDGIPQSFLVDRTGVVRWHWEGGLSEDVVAQYLDPLLRA